MKIIFQSVLFMAHWAFTFFIMFYIFFRKNKKYDTVYLVTFILLVSHWILLGECIISYLEKCIMDDSYTIGKEPTKNPSLTFYINNLYLDIFIGAMIYSFVIYNIYTLLRIHKIPYPVIITISIALILYCLYYRVVSIINAEIKELTKTKIPEWIEASPYLKGIYDKKINRPIGFTEIFNRLTCYIFPACNSTQIDWDTFEKHCSILREKTNADSYDYVVGIESGGAFVGRALRKDCKYIKISKYDDNPNILGKPIIKTRDDLSVLKGSRVLVVDDQIMSGQTMETAKKYMLEECGARQVDRAVLYNRESGSNNIEFSGLPFVISRSPWGYSA